ncbi:hypothetical protein ACJJTC_004089 [Scirpophaga incertulas]
MSDRPGIGHVIVQGVAAAGFDLAPGLQDAIVGVVESTIQTYLKKMVDEAVSQRVCDGSTSRASSSTVSETETPAETESATSDSEVASPPASSPASPASAIANGESLMDTSTPQEPPSSTAALKRLRSDNSSPSGDETAVPANSDSEGGFLEVTSRKKKNKKNKKRRNATILVASSSPINTTTATSSLMDVVVAPPTSSQAPQAPSKAPKAKFNNCSAQPTPHQPVPPVIMRDPPQWSRVADLCIEHRIFYTKARPVLHGVSIEASANSRQDDILYVTNLLASVNLDEICRISRLLQCAATPAEKLCILAQYEHILIKLT